MWEILYESYTKTVRILYEIYRNPKGTLSKSYANTIQIIYETSTKPKRKLYESKTDRKEIPYESFFNSYTNPLRILYKSYTKAVGILKEPKGDRLRILHETIPLRTYIITDTRQIYMTLGEAFFIYDRCLREGLAILDKASMAECGGFWEILQ